jgi:uncharacterized protein (DUF1778 family)
MPLTSKANARLEFRLSKQSKELIERAAVLSGQTVSDFATSMLVENARRVVQAHHVTTLSDRDRDQFLKMLDSSKGPNEALKRAAKRYRRSYG